MLKLRTNTEDWRELLVTAIDAAEAVHGVVFDENCYNDVADQLCCDVLQELDDCRVEHTRAFDQSVGTFVIVQSGTDAERKAFDAALEMHLETARESVRKLVKDLMVLSLTAERAASKLKRSN